MLPDIVLSFNGIASLRRNLMDSYVKCHTLCCPQIAFFRYHTFLFAHMNDNKKYVSIFKSNPKTSHHSQRNDGRQARNEPESVNFPLPSNHGNFRGMGCCKALIMELSVSIFVAHSLHTFCVNDRQKAQKTQESCKWQCRSCVKWKTVKDNAIATVALGYNNEKFAFRMLPETAPSPVFRDHDIREGNYIIEYSLPKFPTISKQISSRTIFPFSERTDIF